ncbi:hypothetical protein [Propionivibrio sp.]|uniref:hypothetical protein n=1 Tax=Propionivibrio sp. TaxID=2212460 RepID=UPI0025FFA806|nr:hypothetical protein [Propionivibrio sp.]MBK7354839.1 hypothetical protein [Propionivibrio sp.]MBK8402207.1 hypothetical protein [Propionivibrio sp.]MBK8745898.1 hypothetical protein [Propionivibrio sp.]MBK8892664.1 hypothetical protein [Propionivibrio sp.]MBL0207445.1 hypothetical protein [Propionivibrio sp.]
MPTIVPDTVQGALIVSVIDFFLSFLIISGIGIVLSFFPMLNRLAQFVKAAPPARTAHDTKAAQGSKVVQKHHVDTEAQDNIAAIAAAVFVVMDGAPHRILKIEPSARTSSWSAEGRIAQHGSHHVR